MSVGFLFLKKTMFLYKTSPDGLPDVRLHPVLFAPGRDQRGQVRDQGYSLRRRVHRHSIPTGLIVPHALGIPLKAIFLKKIVFCLISLDAQIKSTDRLCSKGLWMDNVWQVLVKLLVQKG